MQNIWLILLVVVIIMIFVVPMLSIGKAVVDEESFAGHASSSRRGVPPPVPYF